MLTRLTALQLIACGTDMTDRNRQIEIPYCYCYRERGAAQNILRIYYSAPPSNTSFLVFVACHLQMTNSISNVRTQQFSVFYTHKRAAGQHRCSDDISHDSMPLCKSQSINQSSRTMSTGMLYVKVNVEFHAVRKAYL